MQSMPTLSRLLPVVTVREFSSQATCFAGSNGRDRPGADMFTSRSVSPHYFLEYRNALSEDRR